MASTKKRKSLTAAYAASQPLFDALRTGCERLSEQQAHLVVARDLVQNLHVQLPPDAQEESGSANKHDGYVAGAVRAYLAAMGTYVDIFDALASVTAANPTEGRAERAGHHIFALMAKAAVQAQGTAMAFDLDDQPAKMNGQPAKSATPAVPERPKHTRPAGPTPTDTRKRSLEAETSPRYERTEPARKMKRLGKATNTDGNATPRNPEKETSQTQKQQRKGEKQPKNAPGKGNINGDAGTSAVQEQQQQNRATEESNRPELDRDFISLDAGANSGLGAGGDLQREPGVEYEDVSAEVAARLTAKEERRKAKMEAKKRKRLSDQSVAGADADEKRSKKRSKSTAGETASDVVKEAVRSKKHNVQAVEDEGASRKKRKRS